MEKKNLPLIVKKNKLFEFINSSQIINIKTNNIVIKNESEIDPETEYILEGLFITPNAKKILIKKLNDLIINQLILLKEKMPRKMKGVNKNKLSKKTIDENYEILIEKFPYIEQYTLADVKKKIETEF